MKVYVINLKRSEKRRQSMEAQLSAFGIPFQLVEAVDGKLISDDELINIVNLPEEFTKSQAGCMASHCRVYASMQEADDEYALVLEDDVIFTETGLKQLLEDITPQLNTDYITLLTYYWLGEGTLTLTRLQPPQKIQGEVTKYDIGTPHDVHGVGRAAAYILSKSMAKKLLDYHTPVLACHADSWIVYHNEGVIKNVACLYPMPITENIEFGSDIGYSKNTKDAVVKKLVSLLMEWRIPFISAMIRKRRKNFSEQFKNIVVK